VVDAVQAEASMKRSAYWLGMASVFLLALSVRLPCPASKYTVWYERSAAFWGALFEGDLKATYQSYHPGVTTMWIAGSGMRAYLANQGQPAADIVSLPGELPSPQSPSAHAGTAALGLVIALCILGACALAAQLMGKAVGLIAGVFLALDPFFVAQSKLIHVDALLSSFMLLSALLLIRYAQTKRWSELVFSGVFGGLALLTKSPALFLVPFAGLSLTIGHLSSDGASSFLQVSTWRKPPKRTIPALAVWVMAAAVVFFVLWPAMWVQPGRTVSDMLLNGVLHHAEQSHPFPQFFLGETVRNLGPTYYPAVLAWKMSLVTLPAFGLALWFAVRDRGEEDSRTARYVLVYATAFLLQMTLSAKKTSRYVLPVFLALDVLAAWGLVRGMETLRARTTWLTGRASALLLAGVLALHSGLVLRVHPYPGTHHNLLLGGSRVARSLFQLGDQGEGLDRAARYLNQKPGAGFLTVGICDPGNLMFRENFKGVTKPINHTTVDYRVFHVNDVQRSVRFEHCETYWEACQAAGPIWTQSFDGVPYVWVCSAYARDLSAFSVDHRVDARLGDHVELLGYTLPSTMISAGDTFSVTLFWRSDGLVGADNHVFVHVLDQGGNLVAQHDGVPASRDRPTWGWQKGEVVRDDHPVPVPAGLPRGTYTLSVGMYDYGTKARLPARDADGTELPGGQITLSELAISGAP